MPNWPPAVPDRAIAELGSPPSPGCAIAERDRRARRPPPRSLSSARRRPRLRDRRARSPSAMPATAIAELGSPPSLAARSPLDALARRRPARCCRRRAPARPRPVGAAQRSPPGLAAPAATAAREAVGDRFDIIVGGRRNSSSTTGAVTPDSARKSQDHNHTRAGRRRRGSARRRVADVRPRPPGRWARNGSDEDRYRNAGFCKGVTILEPRPEMVDISRVPRPVRYEAWRRPMT